MNILKKIKNINFKSIFFILLGTMIYSIGIEWFANPNKIINGGAGGASIIFSSVINQLFNIDIPISFFVFLINIPIFIFALIIKGRKFIQNSFFATMMLTIWLTIFNKIPSFFKIENDLFLSTIIVGVLCGTGTGLILKVGMSSGGTDMLANTINKLIPHIPIAKIILILDASIVLFGFLIFGPSKTMYGIIGIFIASKIINNILGGLKFARAVFIISEKVEEISKEVFEKLHRGVTNVPCTGMYTKKEKNLLIVVVFPKEIISLKKIIESKDKSAFVIITPAQEVLGNGFEFN